MFLVATGLNGLNTGKACNPGPHSLQSQHLCHESYTLTFQNNQKHILFFFFCHVWRGEEEEEEEEEEGEEEEDSVELWEDTTYDSWMPDMRREREIKDWSVRKPASGRSGR